MKDAKMETTVIEANEKSSICDMLSRAHQADLAKARRAERLAVLEKIRWDVEVYRQEQHKLSCEDRDDRNRVFEVVISIINRMKEAAK